MRRNQSSKKKTGQAFKDHSLPDSANLKFYCAIHFSTFILKVKSDIRMMALSARGRSGIIPAPIRKPCGVVRPKVTVRAEKPKIVREYREGDDEIIEAGSQAPASKPNSVYADELPEVRTHLAPQIFKVLYKKNSKPFSFFLANAAYTIVVGETQGALS